jgi:hypothetical protein
MASVGGDGKYGEGKGDGWGRSTRLGGDVFCVTRRDGCYVLKETNHGQAFEDICSFSSFLLLFICLSIYVSSRVFIVARQQRNVFPSFLFLSLDLGQNRVRPSRLQQETKVVLTV